MTAPPEATEVAGAHRHRDRPHVLLVLAAPALVFLAIVLPFLRFHQYDLLLPESLILIGGAALSGAALGAISLLRPATLGTALMSLVLCLFALYRQEINGHVIPAAKVIAAEVGHVGLVLGLIGALIFLTILLASYVLRKHLHTIVTAVFGTFVLSTLVLPTPVGGEARLTGALPSDLNDLPPVIHIVLDEHIGLAGLPADMEGSEAAAKAIRSTYADFALYSRAYSRFGETQYSLTSLMNDAPGQDVMSLLHLRGATYAMDRNDWLESLKAQGYAVQVYQSSWLDMCSASAAVDACYTYPLYSINPVQRTSLRTFDRLAILLGKLHFGRNVPLPTPLAGREALERFQSDLERAPRGVAYVVHLMLPHYGFLYNADCSLADPEAWEDQPGRDGLGPEVAPSQRRHAYDLYFDQLVCTEHLMAGLFRQLQDIGVYDDATIIVHGDHGSRIAERTIRAAPEAVTERDLLDHYSTLLAIKAPGVPSGLHEESTDLQTFFGKTFLNASAPLLAPGLVWMRDETTNVFTAHTLVWPDFDDLPMEVSAQMGLRQSME